MSVTQAMHALRQDQEVRGEPSSIVRAPSEHRAAPPAPLDRACLERAITAMRQAEFEREAVCHEPQRKLAVRRRESELANARQWLRGMKADGVLPRLVRFRDGAHYLGMDKNRFNREVRPFLTEIRIGIQGIAFDRFELDAWVDDYKRSNGRPARKELLCERDTDLASACGEATGTSTKSSAADAFAKALAAVMTKGGSTRPL